MTATAAGATYPLPDVALVKELFGMLFDGLSVKIGAKLDLSAKSIAYCGVYVGDTGATVALCASDMAFAANSGAALSLLPAGVAAEATKTKQLTPVMLANLHEIMNIATRMLLREGSAHLKLKEVCLLSALPPPVLASIGAAKNRIDFEVGIGKYGQGVVAVMSL